jgi:hypothetical protein
MNKIEIDLDNPEDIRKKLRMMAQVVMPWEADHSSPSKYVRRTALGEQVAICDNWLGGYSFSHRDGWGWRVEYPHNAGSRHCAYDIERTLEKAKKRCDTFLLEGGFTLLSNRPKTAKKTPQRVSKKRSKKKGRR